MDNKDLVMTLIHRSGDRIAEILNEKDHRIERLELYIYLLLYIIGSTNMRFEGRDIDIIREAREFIKHESSTKTNQEATEEGQA